MNGILDWIISLLAVVFPALAAPDVVAFNGYIEAEYVYAAAASPGRISSINVREGDRVSAGDELFRLDDAHQAAALRAAEAQVAVALANLDNLSTGSRSEEVDVIRASLDRARVDLVQAGRTLDRSRQLKISGAVSQARVDNDQSAYESAKALVAQLEAQLHVAELPARDGQRIAAEASHRAALAQRDNALTDLKDRVIVAPEAGFVDKVYYVEGEVAQAGAPVVSILPPDARKALFFVPEDQRAGIGIGAEFDVECNGCGPDVRAVVTRLASSPQYTPPIIYSREERSRLVFRAEARLVDPGRLLPGQPLSLSPRQ